VVVAQEKSRTALMFKRPTKMLEDSVLSGRVHMMSLPGITSVEGGLPIVLDGEIVEATFKFGVLDRELTELIISAQQELLQLFGVCGHSPPPCSWSSGS
jgi:hypothetical protein